MADIGIAIGTFMKEEENMEPMNDQNEPTGIEHAARAAAEADYRRGFTQGQTELPGLCSNYKR